MGARRYSTEQIIVKLRQAEIEMGRGVKVPEVCPKLGIAEQTFYRCRDYWPRVARRADARRPGRRARSRGKLVTTTGIRPQ